MSVLKNQIFLFHDREKTVPQHFINAFQPFSDRKLPTV